MMDTSSPPNNETSLSPQRSTRHFRRALIVGCVAGLLLIAYFAGYQKGRYGSSFATDTPVSPQDAVFTHTQSPDATIDFSLFWRVYDLLRSKFIDRNSLDAKELFYGAIDGMLAATKDPYTVFFSPKENKAFQEDLSGTFEGIGAEMGMKDDILTIISPLDDSPAKAAGLLPNDKVLAIDKTPTRDLLLDEAVDKIRGPRGTTVTLTIIRKGEEETRDIVVKRDVITLKSVKLDLRNDGVAVLRVNQFGEKTVADFDSAIESIKKAKAKGLVLDLRNDPGGFLDAAVSIAHHFLPNGTVVVQEENVDGKRDPLRSSGNPDLGSFPVVVLINEGSASAAEILAGALRENRDDIKLVGKTSFGKGSVQELIPVGENTSVKITVARWLTPKGNQINKVGIHPDSEVADPTKEEAEAGRDPQLDRALEILHGKQ